MSSLIHFSKVPSRSPCILPIPLIELLNCGNGQVFLHRSVSTGYFTVSFELQKRNTTRTISKPTMLSRIAKTPGRRLTGSHKRRVGPDTIQRCVFVELIYFWPWRYLKRTIDDRTKVDLSGQYATYCPPS